MRAPNASSLAQTALLAAFFAFAALTARAETAPPPPLLMQHGDEARLSGESQDMALAAGGEVVVDAQTSDDIFAAGGDVRVQGARADHLIVAGGELDLSPAEVKDVVAAGGRVTLRAGTIADDVLITGGQVRLAPESTIQGSAMLSGGRLRIEAPIAGQLVAAGGEVDLNAAVGGDARLMGRKIVLGPNARIAGDLYVRGQQVEISPQAVITGQTVRLAAPGPDNASEAGAAFAVMAMLFVLGLLVLHGVIAIALPTLMQNARERLSAHPLPTAGLGALLVLLAPAVLIALLATIVGAPLALFLLLAYLTAISLAFAAIAYWLGQLLRARLARAHAQETPKWGARFLWTALGALVMLIVFAIPILGSLAWLLALIFGLGALLGQVNAARAQTMS